MSDRFETIDLSAAEEQLSIEIRPGRTWEGMDYEPGTDFRIVPPLTEEEHIALLEAHGPDSKIGETLGGGVHKEGEWLDINSEGEPGPEQVEHAVELAQAIITLKGLKAAKVVNTIGEVTHSYLVRQKSEAELAGEDITVIDADEFEAAQRDPETRSFIEEALAYGEAQKNRVIRLLETSPHHAVLRTPSGSLFGISLDRGPEGQELNVTELEPEEQANGSTAPQPEA